MFGVVVLALGLVAYAQAYSTGAPDFQPDPRNPMSMMQEMMDARCTTGNLRPKHTFRGQLIMPQTTAAPYKLNVENANMRYGPNAGKVKVTLTADAGKNFKGFFITGDGEDVKGFAGLFEPDRILAESRTAHAVKSCVYGITHGDSNPKTSVTVYWTPPANYTYGRVQFKATVVEKFDTFYTGVLSNLVDAVAGVPTQTDYADQKARELQQQFQTMMNSGGNGGNVMGGMNLGDMMKNLRNMMPQGNQQAPPMGPMGNNPFANMFQG